jgi:molybdopterin synthase sulfur carrier subunit
MTIRVLFFGVLAEVAQTGFMRYSNVHSFDDLRLRIEDDFPEMAHYNYVISINNELVNDNPVINDGDEIAFMPPFAGG